MKTKLTVVIKENKSKELQQIDEAIAFGATAYKLLGPIHDLLMRLDSGEEHKKPPWVKGLINWYKNNTYTQMLGDAVTQWEKTMADLWESGPAGKTAVLGIHGTDWGGSVVFTSFGMFAALMRKRWIAEEEKEKEAAAEEIKRLQYEESAERTVEEQNKIMAAQAQTIAKFQIDKARRLLVQAEEARHMLGDIATAHGHGASKETMYQPVNERKETKKMAKKYSSFKQQQSITENFRRYMNEEGEEDTFYFAERDGVPSEPFQKKKFGGDRKTFAEYILKSQGLPTFNVYEGDPADHEEKPPLSIYQVIGGKLAGNPQTPEDEEYSLDRYHGDDVSGYKTHEDEYDQAAARGASPIPAKEQKIIDFIRNVEKGTLEKNATVIVDFTGLSDDQIRQKLKDEGIFNAIDEDERVRANGYLEDDISTAIQNWINDRGLTDGGEIDLDEDKVSAPFTSAAQIAKAAGALKQAIINNGAKYVDDVLKTPKGSRSKIGELADLQMLDVGWEQNWNEIYNLTHELLKAARKTNLSLNPSLQESRAKKTMTVRFLR